ncbi:MAG: PH domain-containing protein, partial [Pirellulales bacterium]|nr:PH domain-containing protein [Pirellulales bacterium]
MNQPIAGVMPPEVTEVTCKVVWPTIGATRAGRLVGRLAAVRFGVGEFFTLGKLLAVASIPLSLAVFAWQLMPFVCRRYA